MSPESTGGRIVFVAANASIDRLHEVERIEIGGIHRPDRVVVVPGGKGLNAARAAAALGARVTAVAIVGGRTGEWIADRLASIGLEASLVRTRGETRTCLSVLERSTGNLTEFYEPGEAIDPETWPRLEEAVAGELARGDVAAVSMSGSLPPGAPSDVYGRIIRLAAERNAATFVDAGGQALDMALAARPSVVKVNAAEAGSVVGMVIAGASDAIRAARSIIDRGAATVVVTLGAEGAIALEAGAAWLLRGSAPRGRYAVGSGDAFLAGLATALVEGASLVEAARLGMAAGSVNAHTAGAGELDPAAIRRALEEVVVEQR